MCCELTDIQNYTIVEIQIGFTHERLKPTILYVGGFLRQAINNEFTYGREP